MGYTFLRTSFFCKKENWKCLFKGINVFIDHLDLETGSASEFILRLNYKGGENIRLAVLVSDGETEVKALLLDRYFKIVLKKFERDSKEIYNKIYGIFKYFPQNSIQYGLYSPLENDNTKFSYKIQFRFSRILLQALSTEEYIDADIISSLAVYFNLSLLAITMKKFPELKGDILKYLEYQEVTTNEDVQFKLLSLDIGNSKSVLYEILDYLDGISKFQTQMIWLNKWIDLCYSIFSTESNISENEKYLILYKKLYYLLQIHLSISGKFAFLISDLLTQILASSAF